MRQEGEFPEGERSDVESHITDGIAAAFDGLANGFLIIDRGWRVTHFNEAAARIYDKPRDQVVGRLLEEVWPGGRQTPIGRFVRQVMDGGQGQRDELPSAGRPGAWFTVDVLPLPGGDVGVVLQDITERRRLAQELERSEARFRNVVAAMPGLLFISDAAGGNVFTNAFYQDYTGLSAEQLAGDGWLNALHPEDVGRAVRYGAEALNSGRPYEHEYRVRSRTGEYRWFLCYGAPHRNAAGEIVQWAGTGTDIDERKKAAQHRELLLAELNHRVKNNLAVVLAIANQTLKPASAPPELLRTFEGRIQALAGAHDVLTQSDWSSALVGELAGQALEPFVRSTRRLAFDGPLIRLEPRYAVGLSLALHELATNAVKYGALSNHAGRVAIRWRLQRAADGQSRMKLLWIETDGPAVTPPTRRGFGTRLLQGLDAPEAVRLDYRPEGLVCEITAPASPIQLDRASLRRDYCAARASAWRRSTDTS